MTKRAGKKTTAKQRTAANKKTPPASQKTRKKKPATKKAATAGRPRGSRGKNTTGGVGENGALPLAPPGSREGQIQQGLIALGLLDDPQHLRGNLKLIGQAINERWASAAPGVNAGLRQSIERLALENAAKGKTREVVRCANILLRMEAQNQKDQADQIQRRDEENRINEARTLLEQMQALVAHASQDPAFFDAIHRPENAGQLAGPRVPGGAGDGQFAGGVEVISASGDSES